ncbi:MAG: nitrous oxide-stimulated promoter family protein [Burkholderiales bacterium]|nr:nitrous oxide-stimulated promoter family protein [Burkholderiales bacterium]MDP2240591.1 nitrous oxide-stimulated promoter family protein [Burkholderiales bacterium]
MSRTHAVFYLTHFLNRCHREYDMSHPVTEFITDKRFIRRARELKTIEAMARMYCRGHGHGSGETLCAECAALFEYATRRLERCVFGDAKPTCANCTVHCYSAEMREQVRVMMKWSGPRMLLRHPILGILHKIDGFRPAPALPAKPEKRAKGTAQHEESEPG